MRRNSCISDLPSVRPTPREHRADGTHHQLDVVSDGPVGDVRVVKLGHVVEGDVAAAEHLPWPRDSWADVESCLIAGADEVSLDLDQGARADQAHFAAEHINQLRKLV